MVNTRSHAELMYINFLVINFIYYFFFLFSRIDLRQKLSKPRTYTENQLGKNINRDSFHTN